MSMCFRRTSLSYVNLLYLVERHVLVLEQNISRDFGKYNLLVHVDSLSWIEPPDPAPRGRRLIGATASRRPPSPLCGTGSEHSVGHNVALFISAICSDPNDSTAYEKYLEAEHTLKELKALISKIRNIALKVAMCGNAEHPVLKELEQTSKRLFLALKEERHALKHWPFSSQSRISSISRELNNTLESLMEIQNETLKRKCIIFGEQLAPESPAKRAKKVAYMEKRTTNHVANGGMDTPDNPALLSMTSTDGSSTMSFSRSATDILTESLSKEDMKTSYLNIYGSQANDL